MPIPRTRFPETWGAFLKEGWENKRGPHIPPALLWLAQFMKGYPRAYSSILQLPRLHPGFQSFISPLLGFRFCREEVLSE